MTNKSKVDNVKLSFYIAMIFGMAYLIGYSFVTNIVPYQNVIFGNANNSYMDFWDCVRDNIIMDPYDMNSSYPAIANLFFAFISKLIVISDVNWENSASLYNPLNQMVFMIYNLVIINILISFFNYYKSGKSLEKVIFSTIILLSAPFMYMFERGNIISLALIFLMGYVCGKDSKNKWIREISYICLGFSAAFKIYPAVFGLLLIKDKNYKAAVRSVIYGVWIFVLPFFAYGGFSDLMRMFTNISVGNEVFARINGVCGKINMIPTITVILGLFGIDKISNAAQIVLSVLPYIFMAFAVLSCMFHDSKWKVMALLSCMIVLVPGYSYVYTLVFFIIPIISFLDSKEKRTLVDWACLVFFIAMIVPIVHDMPEVFFKFQTSFRYVFSLLVQGMAVIALNIILTLEGLVIGAVKIKKYIKAKQ